MDSAAQLLSSDSSATTSSEHNSSFTKVSRKRRKTRNERNYLKAGILGLPKMHSPLSAPETSQSDPAIKEFMIDLMRQWDNETLVLVHLAKGYKTLKISKRKSATGRNILIAKNRTTAETLANLKSLFGKSIRFIPLDPSRKITTATMLRVPHPITPADVMELVTNIKDAERLTAWNQETQTVVQTRSIKIKWEGNRLPERIDLGILGQYETKMFVQPPVRCFKCQKFNHTASTCHALQDTCGLCGGRHRTSVCVAKRRAEQEVKLMCSNCKGNHCTASSKCPYRREIIYKSRPTKKTHQPEQAQLVQPPKSAWKTSRPAQRHPSHTVHTHHPNKFNMLPLIPTLEDFPDTLQTSGCTGVRTPEEVPHKPRPQTPSLRPPRVHHVAEQHTPQKKRFHSGAWKQVGRKPDSNQQQGPPAQKPHIPNSLPHIEPTPSNSRHAHTTRTQAVPLRAAPQECLMSVKDIVATSKLIMAMQEQLMTQMTEIQPNQYILNILKAISQSMQEITLKYESCIGIVKA